jgi:hypothetical protein
MSPVDLLLYLLAIALGVLFIGCAGVVVYIGVATVRGDQHRRRP